MKRRGLPDWLVIARRELLERVRTWWFVVVTLLGPVGMIALVVVPAVLAARSGTEDVRVTIVDEVAPGAKYAEAIQHELAEFGWRAELAPSGTEESTLLDQIRDDEIDGFLVVPDDPAILTYKGDNASSQTVGFLMQRAVNAGVLRARGETLGLTGEQIETLRKQPVLVAQHTTGEATDASGQAVFIVGYAVMFILYLAIVLYANNVMRSVVQEKTNRVVEIMVAAAKPHALMLGKILGVGTVGLIQIAVWAGMALVTMTFREEILGVFGVAAGGWSLPSLGVDAIAVVLAYFVLGYFFYASLYAAIGAMVSSDQEAQQAQMPVILLLIVPMMSMNLVANDPRGTGAEVLTQLPFSSPILMPMRYLLGGATPASVALSLAILALSTWLAAWLAARIYRVGILLYGKRPSLRELARWLRYS